MEQQPAPSADRPSADPLEHLEFVRQVARGVLRKMNDCPLKIDELVGSGFLGLTEALERYDPDCGTFYNFAFWRVRGAMIDFIRSEAPLPRRAHEALCRLEVEGAVLDDVDEFSRQRLDPHAVATNLIRYAETMFVGTITSALRPTIPWDGEGTEARTHEALAQRENKLIAQRAVDTLPPRAAEIIRRHYRDGTPFDVIAKEMGISKSRVSHLHREALASMCQVLGQGPTTSSVDGIGAPTLPRET